MTQSEFMQGWLLLVNQPWGWRYNKLTNTGQPSSEARIEFDLYYNKLHWGHPGAWLEVAEKYASGKEWPSLEDVIQSLRTANARYVKALSSPNEEGVPMPDEVREKLRRLSL